MLQSLLTAFLFIKMLENGYQKHGDQYIYIYKYYVSTALDSWNKTLKLSLCFLAIIYGKFSYFCCFLC